MMRFPRKKSLELPFELLARVALYCDSGSAVVGQAFNNRFHFCVIPLQASGDANISGTDKVKSTNSLFFTKLILMLISIRAVASRGIALLNAVALREIMCLQELPVDFSED
jgi:hypothetical protein